MEPRNVVVSLQWQATLEMVSDATADDLGKAALGQLCTGPITFTIHMGSPKLPRTITCKARISPEFLEVVEDARYQKHQQLQLARRAMKELEKQYKAEFPRDASPIRQASLAGHQFNHLKEHYISFARGQSLGMDNEALLLEWNFNPFLRNVHELMTAIRSKVGNEARLGTLDSWIESDAGPSVSHHFPARMNECQSCAEKTMIHTMLLGVNEMPMDVCPVCTRGIALVCDMLNFVRQTKAAVPPVWEDVAKCMAKMLAFTRK